MATQINTNQVKNLNEAIQDMIATFLVEGSGIDIVYNDVSNTLTISAPGGGGGGSYDIGKTVAISSGFTFF